MLDTALLLSNLLKSFFFVAFIISPQPPLNPTIQPKTKDLPPSPLYLPHLPSPAFRCSRPSPLPLSRFSLHRSTMEKIDKQYRPDVETEEISLADQHEQEYREAFDLYDVEGKGSVPLGHIGLILHSLGLAPIPSSLENLKEKKILEGESTVTYREFAHLVQHEETITETLRIESEGRAASLQKSFYSWDPAGVGLIKCTGEADSPLASFIRTMEESMDPSDVQRIVDACKTEDGSLNYVQLCQLIAS